jgi:hypothetical protein
LKEAGLRGGPPEGLTYENGVLIKFANPIGISDGFAKQSSPVKGLARELEVDERFHPSGTVVK